MLYPTAAEWTSWGISDECHQFFSLHWTELFDSDTPDTWQVRTCGVKTVLAEIETHARTPATHPATFRHLLDELAGMVSRDIVLAECFPFVTAYLATISEGDIPQEQVEKLRAFAAVVRGNLADYWAEGVKSLVAELRSPRTNEKKRLYDLTMNVAVETAARGHSRDYLHQLFRRTVMAVSEKPFPERVRDMFDALAAGQSDYRCTFKVEGVRHDMQDRFPADIKLTIGKRTGVLSGKVASFFERAASEEVFLELSTQAVDPEAAHERAVQRLGRVFAGLNLYAIDKRFNVKRAATLVESLQDGSAVLISIRQGLATHYLGSYETLLDRTELLFDVVGTGDSPDAARVEAAIQYHRLALQAGTDEARLVNLWIGLEALFEREDGSIIGRVCDAVAPCVSVDNLRKTLIANAVYVRFLWQKTNTTDEFLKLFLNSTDRELDLDDLCRVLLVPPGSPEIMELDRLCSGHPLIRHRLFRTQKMILREAKEVAANLEFTCRNVGWQLRRIYRERNAIVHTGRGGNSLAHLTQHLHSYFMKTVSAVLVELKRCPQWSLREVMDHRRRLFDHVVYFFRTTPGHKIARRSLIGAENCLTVQTEPFAWAAPRSKNTDAGPG